MRVAAVLLLSSAAEPNPPKWPSSVAVFSPGDRDINTTIAAAYAVNGGHAPSNHGQFSDKRFAFLFKPGTYDVDCPIGYYTQAMGLGKSPDDVTFISAKGVYSEEQDYSIGGALSTFWRSAENFKTMADFNWGTGKGMMWAVSQAAPLRRIEVEHQLALFEYQPPITAAGEASGGFMANMKVGESVEPGSQQQWFARDSTVAAWHGGVWNMVFTGVEGAPANQCGTDLKTEGGFTTVPKTPVISEKPYITIDASGKYSLEIPPLKTDSSGANFDTAGTTSVGFEKVYVASTTDTADVINKKLGAGLHVVLPPAVYQLDEPLVLNTTGQVLLGLGLATLVSVAQKPVVSVGDVDGVRVAGLLLQAGPPKGTASAPALLQWGSSSGYAGDAKAPGFIHDVFARVGGPDGSMDAPVAATTMFHIRSGHVIGDNMWLWRADHVVDGPVTFDSNRCDHALVVDGDDVTMYGLAAEHTEQDLTVWNGERGRTYFYQSELPYKATQDFGDKGYAGYKVAATVKKHNAWGIGVYCFFSENIVNVKSGIVAPKALESSFVHPMTVFLNGKGGILHVINDQGGGSFGPGSSWHYYCQGRPTPPPTPPPTLPPTYPKGHACTTKASTDITGDTLAWEHKPKAKDCCAGCIAHPGCHASVFFEYCPDGSGGGCCYYKAADKENPKNGSTAIIPN